MPIVDMPLEELRVYRGINPKPDDFDAYWAAAARFVIDRYRGAGARMPGYDAALSGVENMRRVYRAVSFAVLPDMVRGFGPVKLESTGRYETRKSELIGRWRSEAPLSRTARRGSVEDETGTEGQAHG